MLERRLPQEAGHIRPGYADFCFSAVGLVCEDDFEGFFSFDVAGAAEREKGLAGSDPGSHGS